MKWTRSLAQRDCDGSCIEETSPETEGVSKKRRKTRQSSLRRGSNSARDVECEDDEIGWKHLHEESYTGQVDEDGKPHGRGTLVVNTEDVSYTCTGHFDHGLEHGRCSMQYSDGSSLTAQYRFGVLEGYGKYEDGDGFSMSGIYKDNTLGGHVFEMVHDHILYDGEYQDGKRNGNGTLFSTDGGIWKGTWVDGEFDGVHNTFMYPPGTSPRIELQGNWSQGRLISARAYISGCNEPIDDVVYTDDQSELHSQVIAKFPLVFDPYESKTCYVTKSTEGTDSGEGLFALIDLPEDTVVSFYNGTKQTSEKTERNRWNENSNTIALSEEDGVDIDVSPKYSDLSQYCASLGHKANHTFDDSRQSAMYSHFDHPRFGHIKCIRTIRPVKAGEELLVDYGYSLHHKGGPSWWKETYRKWKESSQL